MRSGDPASRNSVNVDTAGILSAANPLTMQQLQRVVSGKVVTEIKYKP